MDDAVFAMYATDQMGLTNFRMRCLTRAALTLKEYAEMDIDVNNIEIQRKVLQDHGIDEITMEEAEYIEKVAGE